MTISWVKGLTLHARKGEIENQFTYGLNAVAITLEPEGLQSPTRLLGINKLSVLSIHESDYGDCKTSLYHYAKNIAAHHGFESIYEAGRCVLIAQPRVFGYVFNPACFWMYFDETDRLRAVLTEVNNTARQRYSYMCYNEGFAPITGQERLKSQKKFYVSPFQDISGTYEFRFKWRGDRFGVWIDYKDKSDGREQGVYTNMIGNCQSITRRGLVFSSIRWPFGAMRVMGLIHWQALKLWLKGAKFRHLPTSKKSPRSKTTQ